MENRNFDKQSSKGKPYCEPHRPQYHFSPPFGWTNDPNGLVYFEGEYHLFYQYNPDDINWGPMHWGHAVSKDMIHWQNLPIALEPDELGTIFSGSVVVDEKDTSGFFGGSAGLVAIFTHHGEYEQQSIAYSTDKGRTWVKYEGNPVITNEKTKAYKDFRDPKVFWYAPGNTWIMILGGGIFRIYKSDNLREYELVSTLGVFEEFLDLFELCVDGDPNNKKWVLSLAGYGYFIGEFNGTDFVIESEYINADHGFSWQAAYSFNNLPDKDRCVWLAWMKDASKAPTYPWRCNMSIPRELSLKTCKHGLRMVQKPVREFESLRTNPYVLENIELQPGVNVLDGLEKDIFDIEAQFQIGADCEFGIKVRKGDGQETVIGYMPKINSVFVDTTSSSDPSYGPLETSLADHYIRQVGKNCIMAKMYQAFYDPEDCMFKVRILVDRSTVETFVGDGEVVFTNNIYPSEDSRGVEIYTKGHGIRLSSCRIYDIISIW
ncbi:MAG: glycoside hydrolase family 32 protein [Clostridiaceae bacterium]|jgi:fructan beta-fructosidase|nr:glycoside hydrolase family 32 protein [Clostridiaceae bacterium]